MTAAIIALAILAAACIYLGIRLDRTTKERNAAQQELDLLKAPRGNHNPDKPDHVKGMAWHRRHDDKFDAVYSPVNHTAMVIPTPYGKEVASAMNRTEQYVRNQTPPTS